MESATVVQLSAVLCAAATYSANVGAGAGHPADPQARPHSGANPAGVVGAPGSVGGHLHLTGVVSLCASGIPCMRAGGSLTATRVVWVAGRSVDRLSRHRFSSEQPYHDDWPEDLAVHSAASSDARPSLGNLFPALA